MKIGLFAFVSKRPKKKKKVVKEEGQNSAAGKKIKKEAKDKVGFTLNTLTFFGYTENNRQQRMENQSYRVL